MNLTAKEIADILHGTVEGNPEARISNFARIEHGKSGTISFFANPKYEPFVYTSNADILIVNNTFTPSAPVKPTMIRVDNAYEAVANLLNYVAAQKKAYKRHRGRYSRYHWSTKFGKKVYVGDFAYVGKNAKVGDRTKIYEQVYIGDNVKIGANCILYPGVKIYHDCEIGDNVIIHANAVIGSDGFGFAPCPDGSYKKIAHIGKVIIEDDVEIGACTTIDRSQTEATIIRKGVKLDNLVQIAHNVEVGEHTVMASQTGIAGSAKIGRFCVFGGQSASQGHITIADHTSVAGKSGVMGNVTEEGTQLMGMIGFPYREFMRAYANFRRGGRK